MPVLGRSISFIAMGFMVGAVSVALAGYLAFAQKFDTYAKADLVVFGLPADAALAPDRVLKFRRAILFDPSVDPNTLYVPSRARAISSAESEVERKIVVDAGGKAARRGDRLWLAMEDGTSMLMIDDPVCDFDISCTTYRLTKYEKELGFFVVSASGWEWGDVFIISARDGTITRLAHYPLYSTDYKLAVVKYFSAMDGSGEFSVYSVAKTHLKLEASCESAMEGMDIYYTGIEWVGPEIAVIKFLVPTDLKESEMPVLTRIDGKWRIIGPVTPVGNGRKDELLDRECHPPK